MARGINVSIKMTLDFANCQVPRFSIVLTVWAGGLCKWTKVENEQNVRSAKKKRHNLKRKVNL